MGQIEIWGLHGNTPVRIAADALGHLQIDILSSLLPTGAATLAKQTDQLSKLNSIITKLAGGLPAALSTQSGLKVESLFSGATYVNSDTATDDTARRFEAASKKLRGATIIVKDYDQLFGDSSGQTYPVAVNETLGLGEIDISTLYFKNATLGEDGTVHILGVEE